MSEYIMAHDLGTSANKATLFSTDGKMISAVVCSYATNYFNQNWAEQNADDWWDAVCKSSKELIKKAQIDSTQIKAVSFSGQMMGCLCIDKNGTPLRPSIIWADSRATKQSDDLAERIPEKEFYQIVGHKNTPSYGIQKLMWIRDNQPQIYADTYKVLNAKDYIVYKLTGKIYTDHSDANSMACYDLNKHDWSKKILDCAGISREKLPQIKPSTFVAGNVTQTAAEMSGLSTKTAVVVGGGDGVVANVGCGSISPGKSYCCLGTSAWITTTTDAPIFDAEMRTVTWAHAIPGLYAPNGTMQYAGGSYAWLKNTICQSETDASKQEDISVYTLMNELAKNASIGSNGVVFLPYLLGERAPHWDNFSKGSWLGLKPENDKGDMIRSVLEGVSFNLSLCLEVLRANINIDKLVVIGGGAKGDIWQQMLADICNVTVAVPTLLEEAGAIGAAVIAGVATGIYQDFTAVDKFVDIKKTISPNLDATKEYKVAKEKFKIYYEALKTAYKITADL